MTELTGRVLDGYRIGEMIGQGGMATVYVARDLAHEVDVALKILSPTIGADRRFVKRFRREASLVSQLKHPNIVPVLAYGQTNGLIYTVMPFIAGETLHAHMARERLTEEECARWIGQVAEALHFAHEQGVIHRDIKPSNVILSEEGSALLTDFGLARVMESHSSLTGSMLMGTPAYVSPEQGRGEELDPRSDQYSLGVIMYEAATGRLPFDADSPMATVLQHIQEPVPRPRRFNREISPELETVILKALAKKRELRFPNVRALNEAYQAALAGRPLPAIEAPVVAPTRRIQPASQPVAMRTQMVRTEPKPRRARWAALIALPVLIGGAVWLAGALDLGALLGGLSGNAPAPAPSPTALVAASLPTPIPPTAAGPTPTALPTPVSSVDCPGVGLYQLPVEGDQAVWLLDNSSDHAVGLESLEINAWPLGNGMLERVTLGEEELWRGEVDEAGGLAFVEGVDRTLAPGESSRLALGFTYAAGSSGYAFTLLLDAGCALSGNW